MNYESLVNIAKEAKENSYSPYSKFRVGAALLTKDGQIFSGTNVENASFSGTCCAERTALFAAVSKGVKEFSAIAVITDRNDYILPCGICLQCLSEFVDGDFEVISSKVDGSYKVYRFKQLLPNIFRLSD